MRFWVERDGPEREREQERERLWMRERTRLSSPPRRIRVRIGDRWVLGGETSSARQSEAGPPSVNRRGSYPLEAEERSRNPDLSSDRLLFDEDDLVQDEHSLPHAREMATDDNDDDELPPQQSTSVLESDGFCTLEVMTSPAPTAAPKHFDKQPPPLPRLEPGSSSLESMMLFDEEVYPVDGHSSAHEADYAQGETRLHASDSSNLVHAPQSPVQTTDPEAVKLSDDELAWRRLVFGSQELDQDAAFDISRYDLDASDEAGGDESAAINGLTASSVWLGASFSDVDTAKDGSDWPSSVLAGEAGLRAGSSMRSR